ncbi:MAG: hypothetical protein E6Z78_05855 [Veillonella sp.]|nr:hypothetical protein [Veillonella sp.]
MKKLLVKSVLSAMAVGLLCAGYVLADVVNDSISTDNVGVSATITNDMPRVHPVICLEFILIQQSKHYQERLY